MPGSTIVKGHARQILIKDTGLSVTGSGGAALGVFAVAQYSRFTGLFSVVGSATFRWQMGVDSSAFQVSSSVLVTSGASIFDQVNYGQHVSLAFTQMSSQASAVVLIMGEPLR